MALTDFFKINLPYGIRKNAAGEWFAFNRDYIPLGAKERDFVAHDEWLNKFVGVHYKGLTENFLLKLGGEHVEKDANGKIVCVWLYTDATKPTRSPSNWAPYLDKLKKLSKLQVKRDDL